MSSALQVPGVEIRGEWREGCEAVLPELSTTLPAQRGRRDVALRTLSTHGRQDRS